MAQIFDPLPDNTQEKLLCCYVNATSKVQVVRITNIPNWYFERVAFPGQRLVFEAMSGAQLEVHSGMMSAILADTIACETLRIIDELEADLQLEGEASEAEKVEPLAIVGALD
ncbi:MAG: DUF1830 domain-containing protein [Oculatellaceae cyanobacterium Prado106]|jgi:hypothetical protein|nr:DUF1830 domain-containing protein [Oculatellaceae cyanobacterium Prado106]